MTRFKGNLDLQPRLSFPRRGAAALFMGLGLVLGNSSCSGSGGGSSGAGANPTPVGDSMEIISCSLGCTQSVTGGGQFSCTLTNVYENEEFRVTFSSSIDPNSVNNSTFQVTELNTGMAAPGEFRLDSNDPRVLIFRPRITFNSVGDAVLGLEPGGAYSITIPGTIQDTPTPTNPGALEFIRDVNGKENAVRLSCVVQATLGVLDLNPNADPSAVIAVDQLDLANPGQTLEVNLSPATSPANIDRNSTIRMVFNDVLDPNQLVNPVTGLSSLISVRVDPDQNLNDTSDQVVIPGAWSISLLPDSLSTELEFTPTAGYPSAGKQVNSMGDPIKRIVVVTLSPNIADLAGNKLLNAGSFSFIPEVIDFPSVTLNENFNREGLHDAPRGSASSWGSGLLIAGNGGGTGFLGELSIPAGQVAPTVFNTDFEDFSGFIDDDGNDLLDRGNFIDVADPANVTVSGGVFEFSRFLVPPGAVIQAVGSNPLQIYAAGELLIQGRMIAVGAGGAIHDPAGDAGGAIPVPGPAGSNGGAGGARPDGTGIDNSAANPSFPVPADVMDPLLYIPFNGAPGQGIPIFDPMTLMELSREGGGGGGLAWPQPGVDAMFPLIHFPDPNFMDPNFPGATDVDDIAYISHDHFALCSNSAPGGSGAGGAFAFPGLGGSTGGFSSSPAASPLPPNTAGGDNAPLNLTDQERTLNPDLGFLRGGSGGGGGGGHLANSKNNGRLFSDCSLPSPDGSKPKITNFVSSSGAAGGSGGGAVHLQSGSRTQVNGLLELGGGLGGDASTVVNTQKPASAQPGGGGSGGSLLLQGPVVDLPLLADVIDISGGRGGIGKSGSMGGNGSPGLLRVESIVSPALDTPVQQDFFINNRALAVVPSLSALQDAYGSMVEVKDYFTAGPWSPRGSAGPSGSSASQSCWYSQREFRDPVDPDEPLSNFFQLAFDADSVSLPGWDLVLNLSSFPGVPQSYRGDNDLTGPGGASFQTMFGNTLGGAPFIVRFQAAHAIGTLAQACNVELGGANTEITPGSLTPWVDHPSDLAAFSSTADQAPNMIRFRIIWNSTNVNFGLIESIEDINIRFTPD